MRTGAGEFRQAGRSSTFLATPVRRRVVTAKLATYLTLGLLVALVATALQLAIALPWLAADGHGIASWRADVTSPVIANLVAGACYSALGVGIGLLVRNQLVALIVAIGWFTIAESTLAILAPSIARFLPGGAFSGVDTDGLQLLPLDAAVPLLAAYLATVSLLALRTALRRDIT